MKQCSENVRTRHLASVMTPLRLTCNKVLVSGPDETRSISADSAKRLKKKSHNVRINYLYSYLPPLLDSDPNLSGTTRGSQGCVSVQRHMLKKKKKVADDTTQRCVIIWKQKAEHSLTGDPSEKQCVRVWKHMSKKIGERIVRNARVW